MFRFTIRDVLWLTALVAMGAGWWLEFKQRGPENTKLRQENTRLLGEHKQAKDDYAELIGHVSKTDLEKTRDYLALWKKYSDLKRADREDPDKFMPAEPGDWQMKGRPTPR